MKQQIIYIEQYINEPCNITVIVKNEIYIININLIDFKKNINKQFYSNNNSYTCQIKGYLVNKNKQKNRSQSPTPSNIKLNIDNNLIIDSTPTDLPTMCLNYLLIPIEHKYTRDNPLRVDLIIEKKVEINKEKNIEIPNYKLFWILCICFLIWLFII